MKKAFKKLQQHLNSLPIQKKMLMLLLIASIIPLLIVTIYGSIDSRNRLREQAEEDLQNMTQRLSAGVDSIITPIEQISSLIYTDSKLQAQINHNYVSDMEYINAYNEFSGKLSGFLVANGNIDRLTIYTDNATLGSDGFFIRPKGSDFPFPAEKSASHVSVIRCIPSRGKDGERLVVFARPLNYGYQVSYDNFLMISVRESVFSAFLPDAPGVWAVVTDSAGTIMSATQKAQITQNVGSICAALDNYAGGAPFLATIDGEEHIVTCDTLANGWRSISAISCKNVYADSLITTRRTLLIFGACILISCLLILLISRYFTQRFQSLMRQVEKIENNDFSVTTLETSTDEIGKLAASMNKMAAALDNAINDVYLKEIQQKNTQLQLLQSQINPHLLYNSLSSISSMALRKGNTELGEFTNHLSQFYRLSLSKGQQYISIQKEIELTQHYIAIQMTRFPGMFEFIWEIDETLLECVTPKLILQPFVENVVNHAVKSSTEPVFVVLQVSQEGDDLIFTISDNGAGIPPEIFDDILDPKKSPGYGLVNVNERIRLCFGAEYGVTLESQENIGTTARIILPKTTRPGGTLCPLL